MYNSELKSIPETNDYWGQWITSTIVHDTPSTMVGVKECPQGISKIPSKPDTHCMHFEVIRSHPSCDDRLAEGPPPQGTTTSKNTDSYVERSTNPGYISFPGGDACQIAQGLSNKCHTRSRDTTLGTTGSPKRDLRSNGATPQYNYRYSCTFITIVSLVQENLLEYRPST